MTRCTQFLLFISQRGLSSRPQVLGQRRVHRRGRVPHLANREQHVLVRHALSLSVLRERVQVVGKDHGVLHGELGEALRELRRDSARLFFRNLLRDRDDVALQPGLKRGVPLAEGIARGTVRGRLGVQSAAVPLQDQRIEVVSHLQAARARSDET